MLDEGRWKEKLRIVSSLEGFVNISIYGCFKLFLEISELVLVCMGDLRPLEPYETGGGGQPECLRALTEGSNFKGVTKDLAQKGSVSVLVTGFSESNKILTNLAFTLI
jgi:hypothetical protein